MRIPEWAVRRYVSDQGKLHDPVWTEAADEVIARDFRWWEVLLAIALHPVLAWRGLKTGLRLPW